MDLTGVLNGWSAETSRTSECTCGTVTAPKTLKAGLCEQEAKDHSNVACKTTNGENDASDFCSYFMAGETPPSTARLESRISSPFLAQISMTICRHRHQTNGNHETRQPHTDSGHRDCSRPRRTTRHAMSRHTAQGRSRDQQRGRFPPCRNQRNSQMQDDWQKKPKKRSKTIGRSDRRLPNLL